MYFESFLCRCICPGQTTGQNCRILTRSFWKGGWAWIPSLPHCETLTLSFKFLTTKEDGVIFSSAPLTTHHFSRKPSSSAVRLGEASSYFALQLLKGKVVLIARERDAITRIETRGAAQLADGKWHKVDIVLNEKVTLQVF